MKLFTELYLAGKRLFEWLMWMVGPLFVGLAVTLISFVLYIHFGTVLPFYNGSIFKEPSFPGLLHAGISFWLGLNIVFNYVAVVVTPPGSSPAFLPEKPKSDDGTSSPEEAKMCKTCRKPKAERSHHCHVCNKCVLKMDHHCPWISNCVGHRNHHLFVLFLLYLWLGTGYATTMSFFPFRIATNVRDTWEGYTSRSTVIFSFVLTLSLWVAISLLFFWQMFLILSGQTSIEFYINKSNERNFERRGMVWSNPYNLGIRKNFQHFFGMDKGKWWFLWLVPGCAGPVGDGINWPSRDTLDQYEKHQHHYV